MATKLKRPPRSLKELAKECQERGLMKGGAKVNDKRDQLLLNIWSSHQLGRSIEKASILLVGSSGVGKSSTVNHLFGLSEDSVNFATTSDSKSMTRTTTEFELEVNSPVRFETSGLKLGLVDTPGFNDTSGTKQDACNFYSIKEFYRKHMKGCKPNLILILIQSTDMRIQGVHSKLAESLRCLKSLKLVDTKYPNVVAVLTFATSLGEHKEKYMDNMPGKKVHVKGIIHKFLNIDVPVVAIENDVKYLEKDGDFTILPDDKRQVKNLYLACEEIMNKNGDLYGHLIFNEAFDSGEKKVTLGKEIKAKDATTDYMSKEEKEFSDTLLHSLAGGHLDPLEEKVDQFIEKDKIEEQKKINEIHNIAASLKQMGIEELKELGFISAKGMKLKHDYELSATGEKFLKELGIEDTSYNLCQDSASVIAQGYNFLNDTVVPSQIFTYKVKETKYGMVIPSLAQLKPVNETSQFMFEYDSESKLVHDRLAHLNVSMSVDVEKFNLSAKAGFNLTSASSTSTESHSHELSFYMEERLFELSMGNFKDKELELTKDFTDDVKELPISFDVTNESDKKKFRRFFDRWGHFVVTKAIGGGAVELRVNTSSFGSHSQDTNAIKGLLSASFSSGYFNAEAHVEGGDESSDKISLKQVLASTTVKWSGGAREFHKKSTIGDEHQMDTWRNSLITSPTMLTTEMYLEPISTLVKLADPSKYEMTYESLTDLLGGKFELKPDKPKDPPTTVPQDHTRDDENANKKGEIIIPTPEAGGCIAPSSNVVVMRNGIEETLKPNDLVLGDLILSYDMKNKEPIFTKLILFAHTDTKTPTTYYNLQLEDGSGIKLTKGHMILVGESQKAVLAKTVKKGDLLYKRNVGFVQIKNISQVTEIGFCCPITECGNIFVNGILTSCYANLAEISVFGKSLISAQKVGWLASIPVIVYRKIMKDKEGKGMTESDQSYHPYIAFLAKVFKPFTVY